MNGIVIRQVDNNQNINFDEIVSFARKLFANKISIEKIETIETYAPNDETIQAIKECEQGLNSTKYSNYDDFLKEFEA